MSKASDDDRESFGVSDEGATKSIQNNQLKPMLEPGVIKAFVAGLVVGNLNKRMMMGFLVGAIGGIYVQQNIAGVPDVARTVRDLMERWRRAK